MDVVPEFYLGVVQRRDLVPELYVYVVPRKDLVPELYLVPMKAQAETKKVASDTQE
jgi:hypothetical protein